MTYHHIIISTYHHIDISTYTQHTHNIHTTYTHKYLSIHHNKPSTQNFTNHMHSTSTLYGKMIKNYTLSSTITTFSNPFSELVHATLSSPNNQHVSIYAIEKSLIDNQSFILYQNSLATIVNNDINTLSSNNNSNSHHYDHQNSLLSSSSQSKYSPLYYEIIQSTNYIYLAF